MLRILLTDHHDGATRVGRWLCTKSENPTHGSGWMRSSPVYKTKLREHIEIPPHGSVGIVQVRTIHLLFCDFASVFIFTNVDSVDLNHPHTAVWGIPDFRLSAFR